MANFITLIRLLLTFAVVAIAFYAAPIWQLANVLLFIFIIILDGIDGIIARARNEASLFGAIFDIAADRIIEITLWITFTKLNLVPMWVAILFVTRGILVDSLRNIYTNLGHSPFSIMKSALGKFLVASRTMRFIYGLVKLTTFSWLLFILPLPHLYQNLWEIYASPINLISAILIYLTVILCLLRGIPVLWETLLTHRGDMMKLNQITGNHGSKNSTF